jgi:hypothetical protein
VENDLKLGCSAQQLHQPRSIRKTFCQRLIKRCQADSMLPGERYKIMVSDLIRANDHIRTYNTIGAAQVVGYEFMAGVCEKLAKNTKRLFRCQNVTQQRV